MGNNISTREAYGQALAEFGQEYDFVVCDADTSKATRTEIFAKKFPERFINFGISENDMASTAAGIASCGKKVFISAFAGFAAGKAYDAVRNSIAHSQLDVKVCATHAGILINEDGATHQCIEDIALMRAIPGMTVIAPSDASLTRAAVKVLLNHKGPAYMRMGGKYIEEPVHDREVNFEIGKGIVVRDGSDVTIIAIGRMVNEALKSAEMLKDENISACVIDMASIKPIDTELIAAYARKTGAIVTAEDHNIHGGLGSAVAEVTAQYAPVLVRMVGINDKFGMSGSYEAMSSAYGLTAEEIVKASRQVIESKIK